MKKITIFIFIGLLIQFAISAQNLFNNGSFEYGLNNSWIHSIENGASATFKLTSDKWVMDGTSSLMVQVTKKGSTIYSIKSSNSFTATNDSIYLLRFWANGKKGSFMYVTIEGKDTVKVLYKLHYGRTMLRGSF